MNIEYLLLAIVILLVLILAVHVFALWNEISWVKGFQMVLEDQESKRKDVHADIGDLIRDKKYKDAIIEINKRIERSGVEGALLWHKGRALYMLERWKESKEAINKAIELEPSYKKDLQPYLDVLRSRLDENA